MGKKKTQEKLLKAKVNTGHGPANIFSTVGIVMVSILLYSYFMPPPAVFDEDGVRELSDKDFDYVANQQPTLVMFYAPWCGHCKKLKPHFAEGANLPAEERSGVMFAKMDCTSPKSKVTCKQERFGPVAGYPTLFLVDNHGSIEAKVEGRDKETLLAEVAKGAEVIKEEAQVAEAKAKEEELELQAQEEASQVVKVTDEDYAQQDFAKKMTFMKFYAPWCGHCKKLAPKWMELAADEEVAAKMIIAKSDCTGKAKKFCGDFKVKGYPSLYLLQRAKGKLRKVKYGGHFELEDLKEWAMKGFAKNLKEANAKIREEREAKTLKRAERETSPIKYLKNADFTLKKFKKTPHFVKFFAPWCGHCKALAPVWEELARDQDIKQKGVVVAKADCTEEAQKACKNQEVTSYPVLRYMFQGETVDYEGSRDFDGFKSFALIDTIDQIRDAIPARIKAANEAEEQTKKDNEQEAKNEAFTKFIDAWDPDKFQSSLDA